MRLHRPAALNLWPALIFLLVACSNNGQSADSDVPPIQASGTVFDDVNRNGEQDNGEPGVPDVSVSNGLDVARTAADGSYSIPLAAEQILFVSQPAGFVVPVDRHHLPRFYYMHFPEGSPTTIAGTTVEWRFPVIEPTGPLPKSIDFPLHRLTSTDVRFYAHAFADPQAGSDLEQDMLREDLINTLLGNPYDARFSITVGDVVNDNLRLYERHKVMMGLIGTPQWNLPGNHDVNYQSPDAQHANETYKRHFGPLYYSFNYGNVHVVALNNVEYAGAKAGTRRRGSYRGYISADQIQWLEKDLQFVPKDRLIVVATHIPLFAEATDGTASISGPDTENATRLLELLRPFDRIYGLAGHDTSNSWKVEVNHRHGWTGRPWIAHTLAEARGSGWTKGSRDARGVADAIMADGNPNGFYLLKFDDRSLVPEFIPFPFGPDAVRRVRVVLDPEPDTPRGSIRRGPVRPGTKVVVNLFDGGVRDSVKMSLDGGEWQQMTYVIRTDPFVETSAAAAADANPKTPFPKPEASAHLWELAVPSGLNAGLHSIRVKAVDEFGQQRDGVLTFEIVDE